MLSGGVRRVEQAGDIRRGHSVRQVESAAADRYIDLRFDGIDRSKSCQMVGCPDILGPIGSGKSTVVRLLLGLYQPTEGALLADGIDIRQIDPTGLRRNIGAVLQEPCGRTSPLGLRGRVMKISFRRPAWPGSRSSRRATLKAMKCALVNAVRACRAGSGRPWYWRAR